MNAPKRFTAVELNGEHLVCDNARKRCIVMSEREYAAELAQSFNALDGGTGLPDLWARFIDRPFEPKEQNK